MRAREQRASLWLLASLGAGAAFAAVTRTVHRADVRRADSEGLARVRALRGDVVPRAARALGPIGKWYVHLPLAVAAATKLALARRSTAGLSIVAASLGGAVASRVLDRALPQPPAPPAKERGEPTYPSGHALETTAVAVAGGYILVREGLAPAWAVAPLALWPALAAFSRLTLDRHWPSDLAGGYLAGLAIGSACAGAYELSERRAAGASEGGPPRRERRGPPA